MRREEVAHQTRLGDGRAHDVDDALLRLRGNPRPERQREVLRARLLGRGQRARFVAEEAQRRLEVERRRVVRRGGDARLGERRADRVALARAADEEVVDVARLVLRQLHELAEPELGVARRRGAARLVPAGELRQEDAQERGLQLVEAGVVADEVEGRLVARAVEGEELDAVGELLVVRRHEPSVAEAEEVLRGIEAEGRDRAVLRDARRAEGLRRVLEHGDAELDAAGRTSSGRPNRWTGTIARVRSVTFAAASSRSRLSVAGSMSAKTGVAPRRTIDSAVA